MEILITMRNIITLLIFIWIFHIIEPVNAQTSDSLTARCFEWSIPIKTVWPMSDKAVDASIDYKVGFLGVYKYSLTCDYTDYWKCSPKYLLYQKVNGEFIGIKNEDMFNSQLEQLLKLIDKELMKNYIEKSVEAPDCFKGLDKPKPCQMEELKIDFNNAGIRFKYSFPTYLNDVGEWGTLCGDIGNVEINFPLYDILPYLKNQTTLTPNYCTPSGTKVNVRSEPSVKASVNFQRDKGEFFEILEVGKADVVNGKNGKWYKIDYNGKGGYIFSFYTLCP